MQMCAVSVCKTSARTAVCLRNELTSPRWLRLNCRMRWPLRSSANARSNLSRVQPLHEKVGAHDNLHA